MKRRQPIDLDSSSSGSGSGRCPSDLNINKSQTRDDSEYQMKCNNLQGYHHLELHVQQPYFDQIRSGQKTVEGRLMSAKNGLLAPGSCIVFKNGNQSFRATVTKSERFSSFLSMLSAVQFKSCIPDAADIRSAVEVYHSFPGYAEKELSQGVVGYYVTPEVTTAAASSSSSAMPQSAAVFFKFLSAFIILTT